MSLKLIATIPMLGAAALCGVVRAAPSGEDCSGGGTPGSVTYSASFGPALCDWSQRLTLPKFQPGPGQTLTALEIRVTGTAEGSVSAENLDRTPQNLSWEFVAFVRGIFPGAGFISTAPGHSSVYTLAPFDGVLDFAGPSGQSTVIRPRQALGAIMVTSPTVLSTIYTGAGDVSFDTDAGSGSGVMGTGDFAFQLVTRASIEVSFTYSYCQVGLPPACPAGVSVEIWPPNHGYVAIDLAALSGVIDPLGLPLDFVVTSIAQDEPVDAQGGGDGHTVCDGRGIGTAVAEVRAERQGGGDGRVYRIGYTASNSARLSCSSTLSVTVPHSQNGQPAVDSGGVHDSTEGCP